ncbi:type II toxin-antitoxin system HipA family toxin [Corynebacterium variabile]|uniref:type II toxin-antitoxin system HipA family toxin n=1 Tax=Corynebacterium variabile TaxID=1727 RepID=UPI003FD68287
MTENRAHGVFLNGRKIGNLLQRGDVARFIFDDDYWEAASRPVLGLWFEDNPRVSPKASKRLPPWFSNLLPEGKMREFISEDSGINVARELELLLRIGRDLPGAVEVVRDSGDALHISEIEAELDVPSSGTADEYVWKFSLAGVAPKFSMLRDGDRLTVPARSEYGNWIVKFPTKEFGRVPENEYAVMRLAADCGIDVPRMELVSRSEMSEVPGYLWGNDENIAFAIQRFDRTPTGGKVHIEDFAQIRNFYDNNKYVGNYETLAGISFRGFDIYSLSECIRRLVFCLLVGNGDAHLKNWSMRFEDGKVARLSPAYDLVCTGYYYGRQSPDNLALKLGGSRSFDRVGRGNFHRIQTKLGLNNRYIMDVLDELIGLFPIILEKNRHLFAEESLYWWIDAHSRRMISLLS